MRSLLIRELLSRAVLLGGTSWNFAFDNRAFLQSVSAPLLEYVADSMWTAVRHLSPRVVVGKGIGGYPLLMAMKLSAYRLDGVDLKILFLRDVRKTRGVFKKHVEGCMPEEVEGFNTVFVDDLFNNGDTYRFVKDTLFIEGFTLNHVGVSVLVDLWVNSRQLTANRFPFFSVVRRHDLGLTRKDSGLPQSLGEKKWHVRRHHQGTNFMPVKSLPVLDSNQIYIGNDDTSMTCYSDESGDLLWKQKSVLPSLKGSCCVAQIRGDRLWWTSYDGTVRCADKNTGQLHWVVKADLNLHSSPAVDLDRDRLFLGTEYDKQVTGYGCGDLVSLQASSGRELWRLPTRGMIPCSPVYSLVHDVIVCGSNDFYVYIVDATTGSLRHKVPTIGEVKGKPALTDDHQYAIVVSVKGMVYCISVVDGTVKWKRNIGSGATHSYPVVYKSLAIVSNSIGHVLGIDLETGGIHWVARLRTEVAWGVTQYKNLSICVTEGGQVFVLESTTGEKLAVSSLHNKLGLNGYRMTSYQPAAFDGHQLVIATNNQGISCFEMDLEKYVTDN